MSKNNKNHKRHRYKKYIKKFPCEDCITLPICLSRYSKHLMHDTYEYKYTITSLIQHCSLLEDYLDGGHDSLPLVSGQKKQRQFTKSFYILKEKEDLIHSYFTDLILK